MKPQPETQVKMSVRGNQNCYIGFLETGTKSSLVVHFDKQD